MAADAANAPFALRALQPLLSPSAPPLLRCLGLKLLVGIWQASGGLCGIVASIIAAAHMSMCQRSSACGHSRGLGAAPGCPMVRELEMESTTLLAGGEAKRCFGPW